MKPLDLNTCMDTLTRFAQGDLDILLPQAMAAANALPRLEQPSVARGEELIALADSARGTLQFIPLALGVLGYLEKAPAFPAAAAFCRAVTEMELAVSCASCTDGKMAEELTLRARALLDKLG